ncbi:MAG: 50S ribosomal protein L35 [Parcubacteria group bacterium]|nr:50S ribosomal protein L35 [Parcubacteria group bacterium]
MSKNSIRKRIKITKTGKILRRCAHQGHNQAKQSSKIKRRRKKSIFLSTHTKHIKRIIS